ncbi:MAG: hypothetical protein AAGA54_14055 [Myxococcota bacterium]
MEFSPPVFRRHDGYGLIASHKNLVVSMHWGITTLDHAKDLRAYTADVVATYERFASMVIVAGRQILEAPDGPTRDELKALIAETESVGLGTAFVVLRGGFLGGAAVALLSGLFILSRSREPNRAFRDGETAATWLHAQLTEGPCAWSPGEVRATLQSVLSTGET